MGKSNEKSLLLRYNIIPIYSKAYAKELRDNEGKVLYKRD